jgi:hypothetical protein
VALIKDSGQRIQRTADKVLKALEGFEEMALA